MFSEPVCNQIAVRRQDNIEINHTEIGQFKKETKQELQKIFTKRYQARTV